MSKRYLIFEGSVHSVVYFVQAHSTTEAIRAYITGLSGAITIDEQGTVRDGENSYPHPLAYIEARAKAHGEWQIREMPDWLWQGRFVEAFCGESEYGVASIVAECRGRLAAAFPRVRARAFVWYLKEGTLVTFYRKKAFQITVIQRYLWNWDGCKKTIGEWTGDYDAIVDGLLLEPPKRVQSSLEAEKSEELETPRASTP